MATMPPVVSMLGDDEARGVVAVIAALEASETRYRRLFETAQDGILILDVASRKIVDANPFIKRLLGYTHNELLGKELWEIGLFEGHRGDPRSVSRAHRDRLRCGCSRAAA